MIQKLWMKRLEVGREAFLGGTENNQNGEKGKAVTSVKVTQQGGVTPWRRIPLQDLETLVQPSNISCPFLFLESLF